MHILWRFFVGLVAGGATGKTMKGSGYGVVVDIVIGIAGALEGGFITRSLGFASSGGLIYTILVAILGAVILTWLFRGMRFLIPALPAVVCFSLIAAGASPAMPAAMQDVEVKLVALTKMVAPGGDATIAVSTSPNADCTIAVTYKSGPSDAKGLDPKAADGTGAVKWTWTVAKATTPGKWPIKVSCAAGGKTGTLETAFVVKK